MHILIYEPRLGGHHLSWLRYITEDLLSAGHRLTLAIDGREPAMAHYGEHLGDLLGQVATTSVYASGNRIKGGSKLRALNACFTNRQADHALANNLDEFASSMLRQASVGRMPPPSLKGKLSGVYFRPRFLANPFWPLGNLPKQIGFNRLTSRGWFHRICLLDEYLFERHRRRYERAGLTFLPDPWSGAFNALPDLARQRLRIPTDRFVLLHYGIGTRRKGLHLVIRALLAPTCPEHWHLLCAGQLADDRQIATGLQTLLENGRATVLDRYVSEADEAICFAAADIVLLPYVAHFGSSGVLSLSAAAGKMVVASDDGLIGRRVREHHLGLCFNAGNSAELAHTLAAAETVLETDENAYRQAARRYARTCDRQAFRDALVAIYD